MTEPGAAGRRLKIALVGLTHPFRGGISHYTTLLARALAVKHELRFFALYRQYPRLLFPGQTQLDHSDATLAVPHEACIDSVNPYTWLRTAARIARFRPDLVLFSWWHPFFAPAFGTIARASRLFGGAPSCFLCHNALPHESSWFDRLLLRYAFASSRRFITHSRQDREDLERLRPGAWVEESPHPTYEFFRHDAAPSSVEAKRSLGLDGRRVLLFFGFVRPYKGLDVLLDSVARLDPSEGYHLLVVGEFYEDPARYRPALERLRERGQLTLVDRYVPNEEVPSFFAAADLLMVPYLSATQSGVIQIGYAFRIPVVATAVGGIPEVVADGETGYLVPPGDAEALAAAVRRHFASGDRERIVAAIEQVRRQYSWERMVETVERVCAAARPRA